MGEPTTVEQPLLVKNKMGESFASGPPFGVSVSFGRFENDSLSWEKWSSFSQNKYLEEVEKCSTPGSVAQKKAYFEAHYKKIAARKAELLDQEKLIETDSSGSDDLISEDRVAAFSHTDSEFSVSNGQSSALEVGQDSSSINVENVEQAVELKEEDASSAIECQSSLIGEIKEESNGKLVGETMEESLDKESTTELNNLHIQAPVLEGTFPNGSQDMIVLPQEVANDAGSSVHTKTVNMKLGAANLSPKFPSTKKEKDIALTKKKMAPVIRSPQISTPRTSKPGSRSPLISASQSSAKKANGLSSRRTNHSSSESRRIGPTSLHMSLSLDHMNNSASFTTTRKSLIMEKMGDKDIVKRAFKTFQNSYNQSKPSNGERPLGLNEVPCKELVQKVPNSLIPLKENERMRKGVEKMCSQRPQLRASGDSISARSFKGANLGDRNGRTVTSSISLRSDERAEKRKEFSKKLEEKSNAKEAEKTRLAPKPKGVKDAEVKKIRQNLNSKGKTVPAFNQGQGISKFRAEKGVVPRTMVALPKT